MNAIFYAIVLLSVVAGVVNGFGPDGWSHTSILAVSDAALSSAKGAVELAIGLVGYIALFLGLMEVVKEAGGLDAAARVLKPVVALLFPSIPPDHPAIGAMTMNMAANALGLGNAATPFGLKAMQELQSLNDEKGTASDAMVLFLAINTSGLAILPTGIIGLRAQLGSVDPAAIFPTTLMATTISTVSGIVMAKLLAWSPWYRRDPAPARAAEVTARDFIPFGLSIAGLGALVWAVYTWREAASAFIMPGLILGMLTTGVVKKVPVYEVFVRGAKAGFDMALMIIPYLVAILVAVGMFRASGALEGLVKVLSPIAGPLGLPAETLPLALLRPLSGSGAFGLTSELVKTHGPDSLIGNLASTLNGSTETTFYVLAVYFGSVGVTKTRHAVPAGLFADFMGVVGSVLAVSLLLG